MHQTHTSENQRACDTGTLELLYNFGCEIHSQQKIYLPEREMYMWSPKMGSHIAEKKN